MFRHRHRVRFELLLAAMNALYEPACTGRASVLVRTLLRSPPGLQTILGRAETVLQSGMLGLLLVVLLCPECAFGEATFAISGITVNGFCPRSVASPHTSDRPVTG